MILDLCNVLGSASNLDTGLATALTWHIQAHSIFFLELLADASVWPNELAVLGNRNLDGFSNLVISGIDKALNRCKDLFYDVGRALDRQIIRLFSLPGKSNVLSAGTGPARLRDNGLDVRT
jgi:hypothetical protein